MIAGIGGLLAVALFLLIFYRFLGLIAIIGLGIYGVLLYGAILIFNVTLTLRASPASSSRSGSPPTRTSSSSSA